MTSSQDMIRGRSNVVTLTNKSGGALVAGDVCVIDTSNDESVTTTTSAASVLKTYIAAESIANNASGKFYSAGYCPLVTPNASVTRGRYLFTHTVAKQAAENATYGAGAFGVILKSGTTPSVWLFGSTAQGSGSVAGSVTDITFFIDGGGSAITTGVKGDIEIDFACTINSATILADQAGAIVIDIFKCTYAQYDAGSTHPVSGDKITSSTPPTITASNTKSQDTTLSSWTTTIAAGDILRFNVNSATTITRATLILKVTRS